MWFLTSLNTSWNVAKAKLSCTCSDSNRNVSECFYRVGETTVALQIDKVRWFDIRCDILEERGRPPCREELLKDFQVLFSDCFSSPSLPSWLLFTLSVKSSLACLSASSACLLSWFSYRWMPGFWTSSRQINSEASLIGSPCAFSSFNAYVNVSGEALYCSAGRLKKSSTRYSLFGYLNQRTLCWPMVQTWVLLSMWWAQTRCLHTVLLARGLSASGRERSLMGLLA